MINIIYIYICNIDKYISDTPTSSERYLFSIKWYISRSQKSDGQCFTYINKYITSIYYYTIHSPILSERYKVSHIRPSFENWKLSYSDSTSKTTYIAAETSPITAVITKIHNKGIKDTYLYFHTQDINKVIKSKYLEGDLQDQL